MTTRRTNTVLGCSHCVALVNPVDITSHADPLHGMLVYKAHHHGRTFRGSLSDLHTAAAFDVCQWPQEALQQERQESFGIDNPLFFCGMCDARMELRMIEHRPVDISTDFLLQCHGVLYTLNLSEEEQCNLLVSPESGNPMRLDVCNNDGRQYLHRVPSGTRVLQVADELTAEPQHVPDPDTGLTPAAQSGLDEIAQHMVQQRMNGGPVTNALRNIARQGIVPIETLDTLAIARSGEDLRQRQTYFGGGTMEEVQFLGVTYFWVEARSRYVRGESLTAPPSQATQPLVRTVVANLPSPGNVATLPSTRGRRIILED